ncbi:MAG: hypothetical protein R8G33_07330 [Gammaproteobacteria bacterium]|nr:hypothetical protein [Gammaproteobacteria bacterium]
MADNFYQQTLLPVITLFSSIGTLVCCALPALFVTLGMGAALAGLVSTAPWLVAISEYKVFVFVVAGLLLLASASLQWKARNQPCPLDLKQAEACSKLRKISWIILVISILIYLVGFFFAFLAAKLF